MRSALAITLSLLAHSELHAQALDLLPLDQSERVTRIALGSCERQGDPQPIWEAIAESKPDLFVFLGDNIYGDSKDMRVLKTKYAQLAAGRVIGPQVEIETSGEYGAEAGYIYAEATGLGWLTPKERLIPHKHFQDDHWNHYRVLAEGPRIRTWINGKLIEDLTDEKAYAQYPRGFIGLQVHRIKPSASPYTVAWRNLRIKTVGAAIQEPVTKRPSAASGN